MNVLFVTVWLSLGLLLTAGGVLALAISTRNGTMALMPVFPLVVFAVTTLVTADQSMIATAGYSVLSWFVGWFVMCFAAAAFSVGQHYYREYDPN